MEEKKNIQNISDISIIEYFHLSSKTKQLVKTIRVKTINKINRFEEKNRISIQNLLY